jgi:hypothetical protein
MLADQNHVEWDLDEDDCYVVAPGHGHILPRRRDQTVREMTDRSSRRWQSDGHRSQRVYRGKELTTTEPPMMSNAIPGEVVFGVYGADEWATSTHLRQSIERQNNTIIEDGTWVTPQNWSFGDWVLEKAGTDGRYNFMSKNRALMFFDWGMIEATRSQGKLQLDMNGVVEDVRKFNRMVDSELHRAENLIEWVYGTKGQSVSVPLNYRAAIKGAYPWIGLDIEQYIENYLNSQASVLILIGPPGTGKTTFIKNLIHRSGGNAKVTYDEKVMNDDQLFASFIEDEAKFLVMEDADSFLKTREDGNTMMHRFLNVSDGLISAQDKKLVFSTNLPSVRDIDAALMRPGRCFDVLTFRAMTRAEAQVVADELGLELPDGAEFTLAELFNEQPSSGTRVNRKVGFM